MNSNDLLELARDPAVGAFTKMTVVLAATCLLLLWTRRRSAFLRYRLAAAGLVIGALVPIVVWLLPPFESTTVLLPLETPNLHISTAPALEAQSAGISAASVAPEPAHPFDVTRTLAAIWALGSVLLLAARIRDLVEIRARTAGATRAPEVEVLALSIGRRMGVPAVDVRVRDDVAVPLTWGFLRAHILLPARARTWPHARLREVLVHELVHARQRDYWVHWGIEIVRSIYWFHPLVWFLARSASINCELACDDAVVRQGVRPASYAGTLLEVARAAQRRPIESAGLSFARPRRLADRVRRILDVNSARNVEARTLYSLTAALAAVAIGATPWSTATRPADGVHEILAKQRAAWTLGEREDSRAVGELIGALSDASPEVRAVAAWSLGEIKDRTALPALYELVNDRDLYVREMAVRAIGEHECPCSLDVLEKQLGQAEPSVRVAAAAALAEIRTPRACELLQRASTDAHAAVRTQALMALASSGLEAVPDGLWTAIGDRDARVRAAACRLFGALGDVRAVDSLLEALRDPDTEVRAATTWALDEINPTR